MKKLLGIVVLGLLWCNTGHALPDCKGSDFKKWKNCTGKFTTKTGDDEYSYHGEFGDKPGLREGFGKLTFEIGKYIGEFKNSKPDGLGFWNFGDTTYIGELKGDKKKHGWGVLIKTNGNIIAGQFENDNLNGYANIIGAKDYLVLIKGFYIDSLLVTESRNVEPQCVGEYVSPVDSKNQTNCRGDAYIKPASLFIDADWINGVPTGIASVSLFEGALSRSTGFDTGVYVGELKIVKDSGWGERDGMGVAISAYSENNIEGIIQVGQWKKGSYNGKGITVWPNGDLYIGQFKKGLKHGKGIYMFKDGKWYSGDWKKGNEDGFGTVRHDDGFSFSAQFQNGKIVE